MVTTERKMVTIQEAERIYREANGDVEVAARKLHSLPKRQPPPPPPAGGISQSEASRKYGVRSNTISRWTSAGYVPVLMRTTKEVYIDEKKLAEVVAAFKSAPGQGKKTVKRKFAA